MDSYKVVDHSSDNSSIEEGKATLEQSIDVLPREVYERLLIPGTISIKESAGHESYEATKV